jgi:hypothetical protein
MPPSLFPLACWDRLPDHEADAALLAWGHWLGACARPFGRQSFGLWLAGDLVSVAVSASTVTATCGGYPRGEVVELARLCSHPDRRDLTRVALRLWRVTAPAEWTAAYWPIRALVSYANALRHKGDLYRFDGWQKVADVPGGVAGGGWQQGKRYERKSVWVYKVAEQARAQPDLRA